jgi:hypothetical protein
MTTLSHTPAYIIRQFCINELLVGDNNASEWPSFVSSLPTYEEVGNDAVCFTNIEPVLLGRIIRDGSHPERYGVQIRFRAFDSEAAWKKGRDVQDALDSLLRESITIDSVAYVIGDANRSTSLLPMGYEDETRLYHIATNYTITIE